eukprot:scaffold2130_cov402-Prasinococcus_capsulatus_cf.AAC.1
MGSPTRQCGARPRRSVCSNCQHRGLVSVLPPRPESNAPACRRRGALSTPCARTPLLGPVRPALGSAPRSSSQPPQGIWTLCMSSSRTPPREPRYPVACPPPQARPRHASAGDGRPGRAPPEYD